MSGKNYTGLRTPKAMDRQIALNVEELPDLSSRIDRLRSAADELMRLPDHWLGALGSVISGVEWYLLGAVMRTSSLVDGFCQLVQTRNTLAAAALLRLQIDTAMRVHGLSLVANPIDAGERLMREERYDRLTTVEGTRLRDAVLHASLSQKHPWVSAVYAEASGHIHLSASHIGTRVTRVGKRLFFNLRGIDDARSDEDYYFLVDYFFASVRLTGTVLRDFSDTLPALRRRDE